MSERYVDIKVSPDVEIKVRRKPGKWERRIDAAVIAVCGVLAFVFVMIGVQRESAYHVALACFFFLSAMRP